MVKRTKAEEKKVQLALSLPQHGKSGTIIAPRWRIQARFLAQSNSAVRQTLTMLARAEEKQARA